MDYQNRMSLALCGHGQFSCTNGSKDVVHYWKIAHWGGLFQLKGSEKNEAVLGTNQGRYDDALRHDSMLNPKTKQGRNDLPKVRSGSKNKTYLPYPPRSSTVFSCNARMVWLFGSLAVFVQTLASASVVYSTSENDTVPRWTAPLNEQR